MMQFCAVQCGESNTGETQEGVVGGGRQVKQSYDPAAKTRYDDLVKGPDATESCRTFVSKNQVERTGRKDEISDLYSAKGG